MIVLYNCWRNYERALEIVREERTDDALVAIVNDAGRADAGRNGESEFITTLGEAGDHDEGVGNGHLADHRYPRDEDLVQRRPNLPRHPRGGRDVDDF